MKGIYYNLWYKHKETGKLQQVPEGTIKLFPASKTRLVPDFYHIVLHILITIDIYAFERLQIKIFLYLFGNLLGRNIGIIDFYIIFKGDFVVKAFQSIFFIR